MTNNTNTTGGNYLGQFKSNVTAPQTGVCPQCGYCPHCGRGGHYTQPQPYIAPYPYQPYWWGQHQVWC